MTQSETNQSENMEETVNILIFYADKLTVMKNVFWRKITIVFLLLFASHFAFAGAPSIMTFQSKIVSPSGTALEAANVNFRFTILDSAGTCVLYVEDYANKDMTGTQGVVAIPLGSGTKVYPPAAVSLYEVFNNSVTSFNCQAGGTVTPTATDNRQVVMQFNDGSGWQTLPQMAINAVPFANYATRAENLGAYTASAYLRPSTLPTCTGSQALSWDGSAFTCITAGGGGGGSTYTGVTSIANASGDITLAPAAGTGSIRISSNTPSTSTTTGAVVITGGVGVSGAINAAGNIATSGSVSSTSMLSTTSVFTPQLYGTSTASGNIKIDGTSNATKGNVLLASAGGKVAVGTTTPTGIFDVQGGTAVGTNGLGINLVAQDGSAGGNFGGGSINLTGGNSTGSGSAGNINITSGGNASTDKVGNILISTPRSAQTIPGQGDITIMANGYGGTTHGAYFQLQNSNPRDGKGGDVQLRAGHGNALDDGAGSVFISGGNGLYSMPGGNVTIAAGDGGYTGGFNADGGDLFLKGGAKSGTGALGRVLIAQNGGYVGIGTTSPTYALSVSGDVNVTGNFRVNGSVLTAGGGGGAQTGVTSISNASGDITLAPAVGTGAVQINSGAASTSPTTGALIVSGGIGVSGGIYSGGAISSGSTVSANTSMYTPQLYGTSTPSGDIKIDGTSNAAKGNVLLAASGGKVGIGTTNPSSTLTVQGAMNLGNIGLNQTFFTASDGNPGTNIFSIHRIGTNVIQFGGYNNSGFAFTNGNIGMGTTTPSAPLHIVSSGTTAGNQLLQDYTTASASGTTTAQMINVIDNNTNVAATSYGVYVKNLTGTNNVANRVGVYAESYNSSGPNPIGMLAFRDQANGYSYGVYATGGTSSVRAVNNNHGMSSSYTGTNGGGDALWLDSASITSDNLANFYQSGSTFSGTGLKMDFGNNGGNFTGKFVDYLYKATSKYSVSASGDVSAAGFINLSARASAPPLSSSGQGRIYFDTSTNKFKVSESGGAYTDLVGSGGGLSGLTTNGVLFATGATSASTDNATFSWNPTNKRLGIGTSTPRYVLDVVKSDAGSDLMSLQNNATNGYSDLIFSDSSGNERAAIGYANTGVTEAHLQDRAFLTLFSRDFIIANGNPQVLMMVKNGGNVGIGTDTPNYKLDVAGDINITGSFRVNGTPISTGGGGANQTGVSSISNASGDITLAPAVGTGAVQINSGAASTSSTTGALIVSGGIGASGAINAGGNITTTGSMYSSGSIVSLTSIFTPQLYGTSTPSGNILIDGTSNAAKGNVLLATAGGKVGVGTTTPKNLLHVANTSSGITFESSSGGFSALSIGHDSSGSHISTTGGAGGTPGDLNFGTGASTFETWANNNIRMTIKESGNVGIGTTTPSANLEVSGNTASDTKMLLTNSSTGTVGLELRTKGNTIPYIDFVANSTSNSGSGSPDYGGRIEYNHNNPNGFSFSVNGGTTPSMVINSSGFVGIGTENPGYKLHVYSSGEAIAKLESNQTGGSTVGVNFYSAATNNNWTIGTNRGDLFGTNDTFGIFKNEGTTGTKFVINDAGHVGIGNITPGSALSVASSGTDQVEIASTVDGQASSIVFKATDILSNVRQNKITFNPAVSNGLSYIGIGAGSQLAVTTNGKIGVGTTTPVAQLDVVGQIRSTNSAGKSHANSSAAVDWNNGNAQSMSVDCATTAFTNMLDAGTYILAVTETGTSTCVFSQAGLTFYYSPANGPRTSGKRTVYTFQRIGTDVYVSWVAGF